MPRLKLIEDLSGTGSVHADDGSHLGDRSYHVKVYQEMHDAGDKEVAGLKIIEGWIDAGLDDMALVGKPLTLRLEDGLRLDFFWSNSDGAIANRGGKGLYSPDGG